MADPVELTVVQVRENDRWRAVAVIDGRGYPDPAAFDRAVDDAHETLDAQRIPAQFETREVSPTEPPSELPTWEELRARLVAPKGAGGTA